MLQQQTTKVAPQSTWTKQSLMVTKRMNKNS